jgi:5-methylcytosine-specific restriction protein A
MPTADDFRVELKAQLRASELRGASSIEINSGDLHRKVGGYPGPDHRMPVCCEVMYGEQEAGDSILVAPLNGHGASLTILYVLPRKER